MLRLSRRELICVGALAVETPAPVAAEAVESYKADPNQIDSWMRAWMSPSKVPVGTLHVSRFADPMYFLLNPITWKPHPDQRDRYSSVTVPVGFVTDFASIPRVFWSLLRPDGVYTYPAIVHDFLYWEQNVEENMRTKSLNLGCRTSACQRQVG
jgi:hypothetical protein